MRPTAIPAPLTRIFHRYRTSILLRSGVWYLAGKFLFKGLTFASTALFTRLLLPDEYGTAAIFFTWTALLYVITTLFIEASVIRAKFDYGSEEYDSFLTSITLFGVGLPFVAVAVLAALPDSVPQSLFGLSKPLAILALLYSPAVLTLNVTLRRWEAESDYKPNVYLTVIIEFGEILISVALILALPLLVTGTSPAMGRIWGYMIANGGVGVVLLLRLLARRRIRIRREHLAYALPLTVPLIAHSLSNMMLSQFDRIMIDRYTGLANAGIYSFAYQIGSLLFVIWTATNTAWAPWFYQKMKEAQYEIIRARLNTYMLGFAGLSAVLILGSPLLVPLLGSEAYQGATRIIPVIMASGYFVFLYSLYVNVEFHEKKTWYITAGTISAATLNVILNLIFIPRYGYLAAGWTTLASYVWLFLVHAFIVRVILKAPKVNHFEVALATGAGMIALATVMFVLS